MTAFGHACGSICDVKQGPALSVKTKKTLAPISYLCVKRVNSHKDQAGRGRHPRNCHRC